MEKAHSTEEYRAELEQADKAQAFKLVMKDAAPDLEVTESVPALRVTPQASRFRKQLIFALNVLAASFWLLAVPSPLIQCQTVSYTLHIASDRVSASAPPAPLRAEVETKSSEGSKYRTCTTSLTVAKDTKRLNALKARAVVLFFPSFRQSSTPRALG